MTTDLKLPQLPEPVDFSDVPSIAHVWGYTAEQMQSRDRQIVELCARVAESDEFYGSAVQHNIAAALRALLKTEEVHLTARSGLPSTWEPIETAPKDGTRILVLCNHGGIEISEWFEVWWDRYEEVGEGLYRKVREKSSDGWNSNWPIAWMPLPPVPEDGRFVEAASEPHAQDHPESESGGSISAIGRDASKENGNA